MILPRSNNLYCPSRGISTGCLSLTLTEIPAEILYIATGLRGITACVLTGFLELSNSFVVPLADPHALRGDACPRGAWTTARSGWRSCTALRVEYGRSVIAAVRERLRVQMDPGEAIPLALHLVNRAICDGGYVAAFRMTEVFAQVFRDYWANYERTRLSSVRLGPLLSRTCATSSVAR